MSIFIMENKNKYYAGIAIDIKNSKLLIFNKGYGTYDILNYFSERINEKYGVELSNSGKLFSIKEGDMLMGIVRDYNYDLTSKIYHYLNNLYYSTKFQYHLKMLFSKENNIELTFNMSIVFNGSIQQQQDINTLSWDIINGTVVSGTKYLLNSYHDAVPETKKMGGKFNNISNLPFNLRTIVLKRSSTEELLINDYYSNLIQLLFYVAYSEPFTEKNIFSIRKIVFFTLFNENNNRSNDYKNRFLLAAILNKVYNKTSYSNAAKNIDIYFDELGNQKEIHQRSLFDEYEVENNNKIKEYKMKYSSRITKIISDMNISTVQQNIETLKHTIKRIANQ